MTSYTWSKNFLRSNEVPLTIVEVMMKEMVHNDYSLSGMKKPCWLVFKDKDTNDFCCIGKVDIEHQKLSDVMNFEGKKTVIRSYKDWNEIMVKYLTNEEVSDLERKCAEKILASNTGDKEWCQLRKYWKSLKQ